MPPTSLEYGYETNTSEQIVKVRRSFLAIFCQTGRQLHKNYASIKGKAEFERLRILLKEHADGVEKVIRSLRYRVGRTTKQKKRRIQTELTYFRNQRHRMRYADYLQHNLPIASGVVEAACKTLVTQRMKCSGMAWSHPGGQAILTLRSLVQSRRWHFAWGYIKQGFQKVVRIGQPTLADCPTTTRV
jgi:hypothetical protein